MRRIDASLRGMALPAAFFVLALPSAAQTGVCADGVSHISMERGSYSSAPGVTFALRHFVATLVPMGKTAPSCLEKMTVVSHADIFASNESLTEVFAKKLGAANQELSDLKIVHDVGRVRLTGVMHKTIPIKFSIEGPVSTDGTLLSMVAEKVDTDGIPIKLLLSVLRKQVDSLLHIKGMAGFEVNGNVLSFSPEKVAHLRGYITSVEATPQGLTLHYGRRPSGGVHVAATAPKGALPPT